MNNSPTIYLIDGDASARKGLSKLLTTAGYCVEAFSSTEDFFLIQSIDKHACLVMDAWTKSLPVIDLKLAFSRKNVHIPIIFLSVRDDKESRDRAHSAHAVGFFRKPIDGPALIDAIAWALEKHNPDFTGEE